MRKANIFFYLFIVWVITITYLSLASVDVDDDIGLFQFEHFDKLVHFSFYFGFSVLGLLTFKGFHYNPSLAKWVLLVIGGAIVYGALMEVFQYYFTEDRAADFLDILANTIGAIVGGLLTAKYHSLIDRLN